MRDEIFQRDLTQDLPQWKEGDKEKIIEPDPLTGMQIFTKDTIAQDLQEKGKDMNGQDQGHQNIREDLENVQAQNHIPDHCQESLFIQDTCRDMLREGFKEKVAEAEVEVDQAQGRDHGTIEVLPRKVGIVEIDLLIGLQQQKGKLFYQSSLLQFPAWIPR